MIGINLAFYAIFAWATILELKNEKSNPYIVPITYSIIPKIIACLILILSILRISWVIKTKQLGDKVSIREYLVSIHTFLFLCEISA